MKEQEIFQQGDLLCILVEAVPATAKQKPASERGHVLAEGEATGHAHCVEDCPEVEMYEDNGTLYLSVKKDVCVLHEEHKPQTLTPGTYKIGRVVEVDPFAGEIRQVRD